MPVHISQLALINHLSLEFCYIFCVIPPIPDFNLAIGITHGKKMLVMWIMCDMFDFDFTISLELNCGIFLFNIPHKDAFIE